MKLLQELFANGLISEAKLDEFKKEAEKTSKHEEEIILENKIVSEDALFELKSRILRVPFKKIKAEDIPADVLELVSEEASNNYKMASFARTENMVHVAMVYPDDFSAQNALRFLANQAKFNYQVYLITPTNFAEIQKQRKTLGAETKKALEQFGEEKKEVITLTAKTQQSNAIADDAPVIKMVLVILRHAIEAGASDIHIEPLGIN